MLDQQALDYIASQEQEALALLKEIAQIPAPSGKEELRAQFCKDWLTAHGAEGVFIDEALNVIYPVGVEDGKPVMVFAAHTDVVFPDETPLPLKEENGRICCPGVGDDTACLVSLMTAARYVAEQKIRPEGCGILFVCNSGEEGLGNLKGSRQICRDYGDRMKAFVSFDSPLEHLTNRAVGSQRYRLRVRTRGGHSYSNFGGKNAIAELSRIIGMFYDMQVPTGGKTTYNVGMISGGTSVNTIAQEAEALYEFRSDCREDLAIMERGFLDVMENVGGRPAEQAGEAAAAQGTLDPQAVVVEYETVGIRPCGGDVDPAAQEALEQCAREAVMGAVGRYPSANSASTDCNIPLSMGIPSVCIGSYFGSGAHTREEYIEADSLRHGLRVALDMVLAYCK